MAPFINAVVTGDLPLDVTNNTTLAVGTCLFRAPSESGRDEDRLTFAVDCAAPHQGEVFHRFDLEFPVYPGEQVAGAQAEQSCAAVFGDYIGIPAERSRLNFLYFYPSAGSWADSHVVQCIVYGSTPDEYFRTSLLGAAQ